MNEGWASFWHSTIMTQKTLHPSELVDYADHHSGHDGDAARPAQSVQAGHRALARHRRAVEQGPVRPGMGGMRQLDARRKWDKQLGLGRQKIFEVRRIHNDVTFIDTFLTVDFCRRYKLFSYRHNDQTEMYEIESREFKKIKERLLFNLTNFGQPIIRVKDANHRNRGELYLQHEYFGVDLKIDHAQDTLRHLHRLWTPSGPSGDHASTGGLRCCRLMEPITRSAHWEVLPMSLSKKIAAALDENTKAYVLPCTVTVEDGPNRLTLNLTALDTVGLAFSSLEFATIQPRRVDFGSPQRVGRPACRPGHLPDGAAQGPRGRRQGGEVQIRSQSPTPRDLERGLLRNAAVSSGQLRMERFTYDETTRQRRAGRPASSRVKSSSAWRTTSPPA